VDPGAGGGLQVGDRVRVDVERVAHGGHCVARSGGQVLFVRHALPGERVLAQVTSVGRRGRFVRADAVEVLAPAAGRRPAPCPAAAVCGGCDWQHATPPAARALKAAVVREALARFAGVELPDGFEVVEVPFPDPAAGQHHDPVTAALRAEGLGWRTRGTLAVDARGRAGFLAPRSHEVVAVAGCPQLDPRLGALGLFEQAWPPGGRVRFVAPGAGEPEAFPVGRAPGEAVVERAAGRSWSVAPDGFWQVHPGAADALVAEVSRMLAARPGERVVDLYAGVGLFGLSLQGASGATLDVTLVEGDARACALARRNATDPVQVVRAPVDRWVGRPGALDLADLVVLDPPRVGAGPTVVGAVAAAGPRAVAYVACDPVALARDLATFAGHGYRLAELVALDLFPTTNHVECVAHLTPA
jgi:tRNA/tmRNA/rRNA uracil-C5-methylase (TrmA/RlmC/RlmD family)